MVRRNFGPTLSLLGAMALVVIVLVVLWHRTRRPGAEVSPIPSTARAANAPTKTPDVNSNGVIHPTRAKPAAAGVPAKEGASSAMAVSSAQDPGINLQCLINHIQNAPASFHWSFQKNAQSFSSDWEAQITRNSIEGSVTDNTGKHPIYGTRSNRNSWNTAVKALTKPVSGAANTLALVQRSSAIARTGTENLNGVKTVHYGVDTTKDTAADASLMSGVLGHSGFIRGAAWVTADGCPVKFTLDAQMQLPDGGTQSEHYQSLVTALQ